MRGLIYDAAFRPLTARWYAEVLERVPRRTRLLDVGIGTAGALARNARLVVEKDLHVVGVDIDAGYVRRSRRNLDRAGLTGRVEVLLQSVLEHRGGPYDAVYFSASFMLMRDPSAVLRHVRTLLAPHARVYFTQTFEDRRSLLMEKAKPLLGKVTTIEFGNVTYERDFRRTVADGGLELLDLVTMGRVGPRSYRLAVGAPAGG